MRQSGRLQKKNVSQESRQERKKLKQKSKTEMKVITTQMMKTRKIRKVIETERNATTIRDSRWSTRRKEKVHKQTPPLPSKVEPRLWSTRRKMLKQVVL